MEELSLGSVFSGYGGLDMGVRSAFGELRTLWNCDSEPGPRKILRKHFPDIPNLGDITTVDWREVPRVDVIAGGSPCVDLSRGGRKRGMFSGTESGLWFSMLEGIKTLRPKFVIWENVRGALSADAYCNLEWTKRCVDERTPAQRPAQEKDKPLRALGRVLADLTEAGYDAIWETLLASDLGFCHRRERVFVLAWRSDIDPLQYFPHDGDSTTPRGVLHSTAQVDSEKPREMLPSPAASDEQVRGVMSPEKRRAGGHQVRLGDTLNDQTTTLDNLKDGHHFGKYEDSVRWQEKLYGGPIPAPLEDTSTGSKKLSPAFSEWMMGLPPGWVTDPHIWERNEENAAEVIAGTRNPAARGLQMRAIVNGVVPAQAEAALQIMFDRLNHLLQNQGL